VPPETHGSSSALHEKHDNRQPQQLSSQSFDPEPGPSLSSHSSVGLSTVLSPQVEVAV
jgi:hypothetical protein